MEIKLVIAYKKDTFEGGIKTAQENLANDGWTFSVERLNKEQREIFLNMTTFSSDTKKLIREAPFVAAVVPLEKKKVDPKTLN